ncbi:fluoride efflux transporter FluC [Rosistilla oblonga]|uniref:fluoride efflux transporter FluC n=1 Tax=Rosistilla oblonga TaxID=2527990 RepID=UPI003A97A43A
MFADVLAVAAGGAIGSALRFLVTLAAATALGLGAAGTIAVNVLGCLLIGGLAEATILGTSMPDRLQLAIRVGLLGGLTTFSTFGYEAVVFAEKDGFGPAAAYVTTNLVLGIGAVCLGIFGIRALYA